MLRETSKRAFDVLVALAALVVLSPAILLIALAVAGFLGRPVLFVQERPGRYGKPFKLLKFRTMTSGVDAAGQPLSDEDRMTGFGRLLRQSSLDELPELVNVLKGEMSLVGPRPLLMEYLPLYNQRQARRHEVRPGLTGWAQVNGRNALAWDERFELDVWYVENRSLWLDLKVLLMTVKKVVEREGISAEGSATVEKFEGSSK